MSRPTAVIGSTGKTGRRIVPRLLEAGVEVRPLGRGTEPSFDWEQPDAWPAALAGVGRLYVAFVPDLAGPGAQESIARLLEVAADAGVERIVLLSGRGEAGAERCERLVLESGIPAVVVRASWFAQNFTEGMLRPVDGVIALPAGTRREPFIDVDDIADVAVAALLDDGHEGRVYEVTGPELLSFSDAADLLAASTGEEVHYVALEFDHFHAILETELDAAAADLLTDLCREVFDGRNESVTTGVREALGREPRPLREVFAEAVPASR
jgi:uncharacterized protein YbjT (DUF2867 family)